MGFGATGVGLGATGFKETTVEGRFVRGRERGDLMAIGADQSGFGFGILGIGSEVLEALCLGR